MLHEEHLRTGMGEEAAAFVWETVKIVVISLAIIIPIRYYLVQPFFVKGASMEDNFHDKDYIIIDKLGYRLHDPKRGDVVVFRFPQDEREYFIKRIIGLPGETVAIRKNTVTVYDDDNPRGQVLDESGYISRNQETLGDLTLRLDDNEYFVLGDNRLHSSDSRRWGPVNRTLMSGRAYIRLWPFNKILKIPRVTY
ncbi:MAG: signal peptidase I [Patescibacteria group bacterium]